MNVHREPGEAFERIALILGKSFENKAIKG